MGAGGIILFYQAIQANMDYTPSIEELLELVAIINEQPARYLPLADNDSCPYCKSIFYDEIKSPEEGVHKMKCQNCSGVFYFDYRR